MSSSASGKYRDDDDDDDDYAEFTLPRNAEITGYIDYDKTHHVSMESHIPETNVGYRLLQKMGWRHGQGLGSSGQGRVDPVRIDVKEDVIGIGKAQEEQAYHISSTAKRKALGSEKQLEETDEERAKRESQVEKQQLIAEELKQVKRAFYCELCDKQYRKIAEYEQHLQSYDHHHKKRFKDMKESTRKSGFARSQQDKRREREKKREERELKRMLQHAGGTTTPPTTTRPANSTSASASTSTSAAGGWVTSAAPASGASRSTGGGGGGGGGWNTVSQGPLTTNTASVPSGSTKPPDASSTSLSAPERQPQKFSFSTPKKKPAAFRFGFNKQ